MRDNPSASARLEMLEAAMGAIADAVVWADAAGTVCWGNATLWRWVGPAPAGAYLSDLLPLQPLEAIAAYEPGEYCLQSAGSRRRVALTKQPLSDGSIVLVLRDITAVDRLEAETQLALQRSESQLQAILDNANASIFVKDLAGRYTFANRELAKEFGVRPEDIIGKTDYDLVPLELAETYRANDQRAIAAGTALKMDEITPVQNEQRTFVTVKFPLLDLEGNAVGICGISTDITDRKRAEEALQQSELKFRTIVENANDLIFMHALDGVVLYISPNVVGLLGYQVEEVENQPIAAFVHPDDLHIPLEATREAIERREKLTSEEVRWRHKDGSWRWFESNVSAVDSPSGVMIIGVGRDTTERKRLEEELLQSQRFLDTIIDSIPLALFAKDVRNDFRYVLINQHSEEIMGFPREGALGRNDHELLPTEYADFYRGKDLEVIAQGGLVEVPDLSIPTADRTMLARIFKLPIFDPQGNVTHLLCIGEDITERERLAAELRRSQQFLDTIIDSIPLALFVKDVRNDFRYVLLNKSCERILGFSKEMAIGHNDHELVAADRADYHRNEDQQVVARGALVEFPEQWIGSSFDRVLVRGWKLPIYDEGGDMTYLLAISEDVTERKRREEALRLIVEGTAAKTGDEFFRACVRSLAEVLQVRHALIAEFIGTDGSRARALAAWTRQAADDDDLMTEAFEYSTVGTPSAEVRLGQPCYCPEAVLARFPLDRELAALGVESYFGVPLVNAAGDVLGNLAVTDTQPMKDDPGRELILKIFAARAGAELERQQAEAQIRVAKDAAEAANRAKSAFLANMSHELRTPLNAILGFSQLMERDPFLTPRQHESLATINRSGEHLLDLINDVLEMSKIEAGRVVLNPHPFDLHSLLQTLREMFYIRTEAKRLTLQFDLAADLPQYVTTDEGKLRQVLINLIGNAVKFTEQGGVTVRVWRSQHQAAEPDATQSSLPAVRSLTLYFQIADTGQGIAPAELDRLFQPFVQTRSSGASEGTGLGLAISRQFVRLMGGEISVTSQLQQGSTFSFDIQVGLADPTEVAPPSLNRRVLKLAPGQPAYRLLIVDDRPENRNLLTQLFSAVGFMTRTATNGQAAIALWQTWQPDLIWMDMRMPLMDGYEATRRIRSMQALATPPAPPLKILALTASAFEEQQANVLAAGCDDFVRKPFREGLLFEKMAEHLGAQYIYEDSGEAGPETGQPSSDRSPVVPVAALDPLPLDWWAELRQAAIEVDGDRILALLQQLPTSHQAFAAQLSDWVRRFCFDEILAIAEANGEA